MGPADVKTTQDGFEGSAGDWLLQLGRGQQASTGRYAKDLNFAWYSPEESLILRRLILLTGKHLIRLDAASDTEDIRPYKGDESREEWQKAWGRIVERRLDCALQFQRRFLEVCRLSLPLCRFTQLTSTHRCEGRSESRTTTSTSISEG